MNRSLDEHRSTFLCDTVTVTDKDVFAIHVIDGTVACGLICLFVAFDKQISPTIAHIHTLAVEIWTINGLAAAYGNTIVALCALTTVVP